MKQQKIIARMIVEVLGSPKEHVGNTAKEIIKHLEDEKSIKLITQKTYETEQQEESKLWSTFSEIEFQVENIKLLAVICFKYMPSSIEIIEPTGMEVESVDVMDFLNDLLGRLHQYDMVMKNLHAENLTMKHDLDLIKQAIQKKKEESEPKKEESESKKEEPKKESN